MSHAMVEFWLVLVMVVSAVALGLGFVLIHSGYWQRQEYSGTPKPPKSKAPKPVDDEGSK